MERLLVFDGARSPDEAIDRLARALRERGWTTEPGETYDIAAHKGLTWVYIGLGPHADGIAARVKAKAMVPGKSHRLTEDMILLLTDHLGDGEDRTDEIEGGRPG